MKLKILKFVLWLYENHIQEDWDIYTKVGKIFLYPVWFIRSAFIWILFPLFILEYLFKQSEIYLQFQKTGIAPSAEEMKKMQMINKRNTQNFLNRKR